MIAQRQKNKPNPQIEAVPRGVAPPAPPQLVVSVSRTDRTLYFVIVLLLMSLAYLVFCVASMVPQARAHFVDVFLHPSLGFFLAGK